MTAALSRRDLALLALLALLARGAGAVLVGEPPYLDPAYYELVARRLAAGDGFTVPVLWSFLEVGGGLPPDPALPVPSNGHWMPLASILSAASMLLFGPSTFAAQLPMILAGSALVPLTALVAWEFWGSRPVALLSGVLALFAGPMLVLVPQADTFAIFGLAGFCAVSAAMRAVRAGAGGVGWLVLSGAAVGLATLTRIDGLILAVAPATSWLIRRGVGPWRTSLEPLSWTAAVACALAAVVVLAPWLLRQQLVFGTPVPSAGGHTLWITSYNEQFSIGHPVNLGTYLAWGAPAIIVSKLASWGLLIGRTAVLLGGAFIASFVYGLWRERRRAELAPFLVYWWVLFVVMGAIFTFHAPAGAWYHSSAVWLPFAIPIAVGSFAPMVEALGRRWRMFARQSNQRFLLAAATVGAIVLSLVGSASMVVTWRADRARLDAAAGFLRDAASPGEVVMYVDPPSLSLETGSPVVAPPYDPFPIIERVVRAYDVRWLVVERLPGAATDPLRLWEGAAAADAEGNRADWLPSAPAFATDNVRVYAIGGPAANPVVDPVSWSSQRPPVAGPTP